LTCKCISHKNMKTIAVLTDFSDNARNATKYAYELAKNMKADLLLCNTFLVSAEIPLAGLSVWPQEEYSTLSEESSFELNQLKEYLQNEASTKLDASSFHPHIATNSSSGNIGNIVKKTGADIQLVVAGTHDKNVLTDLLVGNHVNTMIDHLDFPLLLIPPQVVYQPLNKIAFAVDLVDVNKDEKAIYQLVNLAKPLNAEILVTHIYNENNNKLDFEKQIKALLTTISNKANYDHIYSRIIDEESPEKGLNWLCENGHVNMLAMLHQEHNFFEKLLTKSHIEKMASHIAIPLLIIPAYH
jgi:nucleotide-binding universal stress UspA family protein